MGFVNPAALWLLLLCLLPLLLSRSRPRVRRVVSNAYLWREAVRRSGSTPARRRRRPHALILVQAACIAGMAFALAGPVVRWSGGRTAVIIDLSASMGAREGEATRLDAARLRARTLLGTLPRFARVRLILATSSPRQAGEWAASDPRLLAAINALQPTAGAADVAGAIELAAAAGDVSIAIVLSDSNMSATSGGVGGPAVRFVRIGAAAENAAVTRIAARRTELGGRAGDVMVALRNYGTTPRDAGVEIEIDGRTVHHARALLRPGGQETLQVGVADIGHFITARLLGADALAIDDSRSVAAPPARAVRVALLGPDGTFLERALAVNPALSLRTYGLDTRVRDIDLRRNFDVVVCDRCGDPHIEGMPSLIVAQDSASRARGAVRIVSANHPVANSLEPGAVQATVNAAAASDARAEVVLRVGGLAAVTASDDAGNRRVDIRLDLADPELALNAAFPALVANVVAWLVADVAIPTDVTAGEPLAFAIPAGADGAVRVLGPDGRPREVRIAGRQATVAETEAAGTYRVQMNALEHLVAVNPDVAAESDLSASQSAPPERTDAAASAVGSPAPIAHWLVLFGLGLLAVEWHLKLRGA